MSHTPDVKKRDQVDSEPRAHYNVMQIDGLSLRTGKSKGRHGNDI